jgi:NAD(P)H-hydrate epimerase
MSAEAALRTGAGMVSVITRVAHRSAILSRRPEIMVVDADDYAARAAVLDRASVLVVGPGLGQSGWSEELLAETLARPLPTLIDADALNLLARGERGAAGPVVVTPHVGEAARLLDCASDEVRRDRPGTVRALARRVAGVAVLKGAGSLVAAMDGTGEPGLLGVCAHGNPGMASAGMGDVLSGIIGGLMAQGLAGADAAVAGTCLHALAGDRAAASLGQRSVLAMDLMEPLMAILAAEEQRLS